MVARLPKVFSFFAFVRFPGAFVGEKDMAPKLIRSILILPIMLTALAALPPSHVYAADVTLANSPLPDLATFTTWIKNGQTGQLRGVYVPDLLADDVVQQPANEVTFVSTSQDVITQFGAASSLGATGLLAHNFLAGEKFRQMKFGQVIYLVYGDGTVAQYVVSQVQQYQALQPESPYSEFIDLGTGRSMSSTDVFHAAYGHPGMVVFQTCIASGDEPSWGRLFIIARPYSPIVGFVKATAHLIRQ
jgi:hypothetical protein